MKKRKPIIVLAIGLVFCIISMLVSHAFLTSGGTVKINELNLAIPRARRSMCTSIVLKPPLWALRLRPLSLATATIVRSNPIRIMPWNFPAEVT